METSAKNGYVRRTKKDYSISFKHQVVNELIGTNSIMNVNSVPKAMFRIRLISGSIRIDKATIVKRIANSKGAISTQLSEFCNRHIS